MKKLYFILIACALSLPSMAQIFETIPTQVEVDFRESDDLYTPSLRGGDIPFWSNDFSDDTTWVAETVIGNYNWEITTTENGWFYNGNINSDSQGEYAFVWNGDPTGTEELLQSEYNLTTEDAIDVSSIESAILEFQVYGARFTDSLKIQVSNDGVNFTTIGDQQDIGQLTAGGGSVTANPLLRSYNMTLDVAGQTDLYIRFNFQTADSGIAYGWFVDDVNIFIPADYDLSIGEVYTGDIINDYEYTITPLEQAHNLNLGGNITNLGGAEAVDARLYVEVYEEGNTTPVYTGESDYQNITQGSTEQFWVFTDYTPSTIADYTVVFEAVQTEVDGLPGDNITDKEFRISEYTWANDDYNNLNTDFDGALGAVESGEEWLLGTAFTVFEAGTSFEAASVSFASGTEGGSEISMTLWLNGENGLEFITSTDYTIEDEDVFGNSFTAIEMDDQEDLEVGNTYIVALQHLPGEGDVVVDCSTFDNDFSTFIYGAYGVGGVVDWFVFDDISPAIRLSLSDIDGVEEEAQTTLAVGQNYPNPVTGVTTIPYSLKTSQNLTFQVTDLAGRVVYTENLGTQASGNNTLELSVDLAPGLYNYSFISEDFVVTKTLTRN